MPSPVNPRDPPLKNHIARGLLLSN